MASTPSPLGKVSTFAEVLESVDRYGPFLPVFFWAGRVIDGDKRREACLQVGKQWQERHLTTREEAAELLWTLHPGRALWDFGKGLTLPELCALFAARPSQVLAVQRALAPQPPPKPWRKAKEHLMHLRMGGEAVAKLRALKKQLRASIQDIVECSVELAAPEDLELAVMQARETKKRLARARPVASHKAISKTGSDSHR
jgi:hypothetical protein